jgi:hypothetical protein
MFSFGVLEAKLTFNAVVSLQLFGYCGYLFFYFGMYRTIGFFSLCLVGDGKHSPLTLTTN